MKRRMKRTKPRQNQQRKRKKERHRKTEITKIRSKKNYKEKETGQ